MEKEQLYLTEENISVIKETIQTELLKRGITAPIIKIEEHIRNGTHRIELQTEPFQTYPVIFKKLWVDNFSTSINIKKYEETDVEYYKVWISVYCSYEHFNGGSNGCKLFDFLCDISLNNKYINKITID